MHYKRPAIPLCAACCFQHHISDYSQHQPMLLLNEVKPFGEIEMIQTGKTVGAQALLIWGLDANATV